MHKHNTNERIQIENHKFRKNKRTRGPRYDNLVGCTATIGIGKASFTKSRKNKLQRQENFAYCHGSYQLLPNGGLMPVEGKAFHNIGRSTRNFNYVKIEGGNYWLPDFIL